MIEYLAFFAPAMLLMMWVQHRVTSAYNNGMRVPAPLSGAAAARHILDTSGLHEVAVAQTHGRLSDHYDPRHKVLRLSQEVYGTRSAAAVGIAAHEAGHALQDATRYAPLVLRNMAVPAANFGSNGAVILLIIGGLMGSMPLVWIGIGGFVAVFLFQLVNLPVEFDASNRAKRLLSEMGIVDEQGAAAVRSVLNAAAWTYVGATIQSLLTLLYLLSRHSGMGSRDD